MIPPECKCDHIASIHLIVLEAVSNYKLYCRQALQDSVSDEQLDKYYDEDRNAIDAFRYAAAHLPPLNTTPEVIRPFDKPFRALSTSDFTPLVNLRQDHQTAYAAKSVRSMTASANAQGIDRETETGKKPSARRELCRRLNEISRRYEHSDRGPTSGLARDIRWTGGPQTGNSANAALAGGQRAATVSY